MTEDTLRFETVLSLGEAGMSPDRLAVEVVAAELGGGKLEFVADPPAGTVIEFKFPAAPGSV